MLTVVKIRQEGCEYYEGDVSTRAQAHAENGILTALSSGFNGPEVAGASMNMLLGTLLLISPDLEVALTNLSEITDSLREQLKQNWDGRDGLREHMERRLDEPQFQMVRALVRLGEQLTAPYQPPAQKPN